MPGRYRNTNAAIVDAINNRWELRDEELDAAYSSQGRLRRNPLRPAKAVRALHRLVIPSPSRVSIRICRRFTGNPAYSIRAYSTRLVVELDPDGDRCAGGGAKYDAIGQSDESVCGVDSSSSREGVIIVKDGGDPRMPAAANLDAHAGVSREILDVSSVPAVLGDEPEDIAVQAIPYGRLSLLSAMPSDRFKQRERPWCKA